MTNNNHESEQNTSRTTEAKLLAALTAILPYAANEIVFINLRSDGSKSDEAEAHEATTALDRAKAAIAEAKGLAV